MVHPLQTEKSRSARQQSKTVLMMPHSARNLNRALLEAVQISFGSQTDTTDKSMEGSPDWPTSFARAPVPSDTIPNSNTCKHLIIVVSSGEEWFIETAVVHHSTASAAKRRPERGVDVSQRQEERIDRSKEPRNGSSEGGTVQKRSNADRQFPMYTNRSFEKGRQRGAHRLFQRSSPHLRL